jgi:2-polyprenyl-6-hydroxyphenyl methylase/3-demethylubiquinone-9 3-methyltransferase
MQNADVNADLREIEKFSGISDQWWDRKGLFRGLHDMNPLRLKYISDRAVIRGERVLDVGCGGGILCEAMAEMGADVVGIDLNGPALRAAEQHAMENGMIIDYRKISAEDLSYELAEELAGQFDIVTCMELLEHVPDPFSLVHSCKNLARPGGHVFFSTLNRTVMSYVLAIFMAEYVLRLMRRNTHDPKKFIKPMQLKAWGEKSGLKFKGLSGIFYIPYIPVCRLSRNTAVNYIMHFENPSGQGTA